MKKELGAKPFLFPQPVLIIAAYNNEGKVDAMNAAWGTITDYNEITISLASNHLTTKYLLETNAFSVAVGTAKYVKECDYLGVVSGNKEPDKFAKSGFTATPSSHCNAPIINELPFALECEVKSYEDEILIGKIVNVVADEEVLNEQGKIDIHKLDPIAFDPGMSTYVRMGEKVGNAFKDGFTL